MSDYATIKAGIVANVEALYGSDNAKYAGLLAALGESGVVVQEGTTFMVGMAWSGRPADPNNPAGGPVTGWADNGVIAQVIKGLVPFLGGSSSTIDGLTDVEAPDPEPGDLLFFDGVLWRSGRFLLDNDGGFILNGESQLVYAT